MEIIPKKLKCFYQIQIQGGRIGFGERETTFSSQFVVQMPSYKRSSEIHTIYYELSTLFLEMDHFEHLKMHFKFDYSMDNRVISIWTNSRVNKHKSELT